MVFIQASTRTRYNGYNKKNVMTLNYKKWENDDICEKLVIINNWVIYDFILKYRVSHCSVDDISFYVILGIVTNIQQRHRIT